MLGLNVRNVLDRRLQTLLVKKGLALSAKQARQFIVHGHVGVNGQKITVPGYLVNLDDENKINFLSNSSINDPEHAERILIKEKYNKESKEEKEVREKKAKKESKEEVKEEPKKE